ncbi:MAG: extracellular solute-binding protein [Micropruina sp.]|uniref:ABC transporter substrate-binding protein n=1 Tax=Micropruina sp. TaxID=2737536 RepID=UPI0039E35C2C
MGRSEVAGGFTRRSFLRGAGAAALFATAGGTLSACGNSGGATAIRFSATKRETVKYWNDVVAEYNASQSEYKIMRELSTNLVADFVRDTPVPIGLAGFDIKFGSYVQRGVLADQRDNPIVETLRPDAIEFSRQFGTYKDDISSLPYSIAGQGVIYNREMFAKVGAEIPKTWSDMLAVCEKLKSAGITPFMGTFTDLWTIKQGPFNYAFGGMLNASEFFAKLNALGTQATDSSEVSFQKDFKAPLVKIKELLPYFNSDAKNIAYDQGNRDVGQGKAAMLMQGPWAYAGILNANPDFKGGMFPLPMTDDPANIVVTANLDLTAFTPASGKGATRDGALKFLDYIFRTDVLHKYNAENQAFSPDKDAPKQEDPLVSDLNEYMLSGRYVQGPSLYVPAAIPLETYIQEYFYGGSVDEFLFKLDRDWRRLAVRLAA